MIHRSGESRPELPITWKLPRTRIEDTVLDLIDAAPTFQVAYGWIARAVSRDFATVGMLRAALATRRRARYRAELAVAFGESDDGVHSRLELRYVRDVERAHGLPAAERQARREFAGRVHYRDNWYAEYRVCVEVDGPTYHRDEQVWKDKRRDNFNLAADGAETFRFGPLEVTERACESAAMVAAALARNGWKGAPHSCRRARRARCETEIVDRCVHPDVRNDPSSRVRGWGGGALSVAVRSIGGVTCRTCRGPAPVGLARCYQCDLARRQAGELLADAVAPIGYAVRGGPLAEDLWRYKADHAGAAESAAAAAVEMLAAYLHDHGESLWTAAGMATARGSRPWFLAAAAARAVIR